MKALVLKAPYEVAYEDVPKPKICVCSILV